MAARTGGQHVDNHSLQYGNRGNDGLTCFGTIVRHVLVCAWYVGMYRVMNNWGRGYVQNAGESSGTQKARVVAALRFLPVSNHHLMVDLGCG